MKLLLDTRVLLWFLGGDARLNAEAATLIEEPAYEAFVSQASLWEIAAKIRGGQLEADLGQIIDALAPGGFSLLDLKPRHFVALERLPQFPDHRDPFEQLLIAQAIAENLTFLSASPHAARYRVAHVAAGS